MASSLLAPAESAAPDWAYQFGDPVQDQPGQGAMQVPDWAYDFGDPVNPPASEALPGGRSAGSAGPPAATAARQSTPVGTPQQPLLPGESMPPSAGDAFVEGITTSIPIRAVGGAAMGLMETIGTGATWLGEAGAEVAGYLGIPGAKELEHGYQRDRAAIAAASQRRQEQAVELNKQSPFGELATGLTVDAGTAVAESAMAGATGGASTAFTLPKLGKISTGLRNLAAYYSAKSYTDSLQKNPDRVDLAMLHSFIEGAATLIGGAAGAGTAKLAGQRAVARVAAQSNLSKPLRALYAAGIEAYEETATELAHYLTDVLATDKQFNGKELAGILNRTAAVAGLSGGASGAVSEIVSAIEDRVKSAPAGVQVMDAVSEFMGKATPEQQQAAASATSRGAFTQATGQQRTTQQWREVFTSELQRRLDELDKQQQPEQPRTDNPAPATKPWQPPVDRRTLNSVDARVQKLRDGGGGIDIDALDELLSNDPQQLADIFAEADRRAEEHNLLMNEARNEWDSMFGGAQYKQTRWVKKSDGTIVPIEVNRMGSSDLVAKAKRGAASDGDSTFKAWDQIVGRLQNDEEGVRFPHILAAAQSLGNGDVESGLFSLLQESRKYFANKTGDEFVAGVLNEALAESTRFDFGANALPADQAGAEFSGVPINIRIDLGDLGRQASRGSKAVGRWLKQQLTTKGLANDNIKRFNDRRIGQVAKRVKQMKFLQSDLDKAVWGQIGRMRSAPPEMRMAMDAALKGEPTDLPPQILATIEAMRAQIDSLSREFQAAGIGGEDLQVSVDENMGMYVTRTYAKHSRRDWMQAARSDPRIMADAKAALKQEFPADSDEDIDWRINMLLDKDSVDSKQIPAKFFKDAKFQSILMQRKNLPEWLRNLYGENRDPWLNHTLTVTKMAQLLAHEQMMADVRDAGLRAGWLTEVPRSELVPQPDSQQRSLPMSTPKNPANYRRIDGTKTPLLRSLDGLYTDPDTHQALTDMFSAKTMNGFFRWATLASGLAKWNVTVGNSKSYLRNFLGNPLFAMANGDITASGLWSSAKATLADVFGHNDQQMRDYLARLAELNVVDGEISVAEIKAMMGDLAEAGDGVPLSTSGIGRIVGRGMGALNSLYQSMDTFWKINGFENKKRYYRELDPAATEAEVEQRAADDVRRGYTYYSEVPVGVKRLNRFPLMGNFLSFRSEVIRTTKNVVQTGLREISSDNPIERRMGARRLTGLAASLVAIPLTSLASRMLFGVGGDDDRDLRNFQAPWTRNSPYLYLLPIQDGKADVLDLGFMDPRSQFVKAVYALFGPGDASEKAMQSLGELTDPLNEDILFGRVMSVARNRTSEGREVYNESASGEEKARKIAGYLGEPLMPGTLSQLERVHKGLRGEVSPSGKEYDATKETISLFGLRPTGVDVAQSFSFRSNDLRGSVRDAEAGIRQALTRRGTVPAEETRRVLADFIAQREKFVLQWHEMAMAAIRLGVDPKQVSRTVYSAAGSKKLTAEIMAGKPMSYMPSTDTLLIARGVPAGRERVGTYRDLTGVDSATAQ